MNFYLKAFSVCLRKSYTVFPWFKCHPFYWLDTRPHMNITWGARFKWYLSVSLLVLYYIYLVGLTLQTTLNPTSSLAVTFYMIFSTVTYSFGVLNHGFAIISDIDFIAFNRSYIKMLNDGKGTDSQYFNPDSNFCDSLICRKYAIRGQF